MLSGLVASVSGSVARCPFCSATHHLQDLRWFCSALPNRQAIALLHGCCRLWFLLFQRLFSPLPDCFVSAERHLAKDVHARCLSGLVASVSGSVARRPFCSATHRLQDLRWLCSALPNRQAIALLHGCCRLWFRLFQRLFSPLPDCFVSAERHLAKDVHARCL